MKAWNRDREPKSLQPTTISISSPKARFRTSNIRSRISRMTAGEYLQCKAQWKAIPRPTPAPEPQLSGAGAECTGSSLAFVPLCATKDCTQDDSFWGRVMMAAIYTAIPSPLTNPRLPRYHSLSLLYGADLGFHAEWLRDEPYEATTTGSEFIFWSPGVNSRPTQGEHEIRGAEFLASRSSFPHSTGKEDFAFRALSGRLVPPLLQSE